MELKAIVQAAIGYFVIVFGAGFILGVIRVLWLVPLWGERYAELAETPLMLAVVFLAARRTGIGRFADWRRRLCAGLIALALLVSMEFTLVLWLRGLSLAQYGAERDPVSGVVYLLALVAFAVAPALLGPGRGVRCVQLRTMGGRAIAGDHRAASTPRSLF